MKNKILVCTTEGGEPIDTDQFNFNSNDFITVKNASNQEQVYSNFVGFIIEENKMFISFPKKFNISNSITDDIELLFRTILKHKQKNQNLYFSKNINFETNFPFNPFFEIYEYYQKYGIYHEDIKETKNGYSGNISWKNTIANSSHIISKNSIVYIPFKIKKNTKKQVFLSECMIYAVNYTLSLFSPFLKLTPINRKISNQKFISDRKKVIIELNKIKKSTFKDMDKRLISNLMDFFDCLPSGGSYYLKHYTFSAVWENLVESYLNLYFEKIENDKLIFSKTPKKTAVFSKITFCPNVVEPKQNIQPDHYFKLGTSQFIFDSKYYSDIKGINYKQIAYYFLLEKLNESSVDMFLNTYSALILPGDKDQKIHFKFKKEFNYNSDLIIYEYYLNVNKAMQSYLENTK